MFALPFTGQVVDLPATTRWLKLARAAGAIGLEFLSLPPDTHALIERYVTSMKPDS